MYLVSDKNGKYIKDPKSLELTSKKKEAYNFNDALYAGLYCNNARDYWNRSFAVMDEKKKLIITMGCSFEEFKK